MPDGRQLKPLSSGDALFLYLEREGAPLSVAAICAFEGTISLQRCTEYIESKLPLVPRYLQRVVTPPFNLGLPTWEDDPTFDVHNHVREITLKYGTEAEFKAAAGRIMSSALPRERPLWDFTLMHGLKGNRTGMVIRTHHCLADGISGVGLMKIILEPIPRSAPAPAPPLPKEKVQDQAPPVRTPSAEESLLNSWLTTADRVLTAQFELLQMARQLIAARTQNGNGDPSNATTPGVAMPPEDLRHLIPEFGSPTQRLPFNVVCRGPQKFGWVEVSLPEIKGVKDACGSTVNDVVLTILTAAIARYAELHGVPLKNRFLRIIVPVNLRSDMEVGDLGNCITFLPVNVPLDVRNPRKLVSVVRASVARARKAGTAELVGFVGTLIECIPTPLQALLLPLAAQLPISACNTICTNVPGPKTPLYLLENKMLSCYPYVPIGGEMGMNCAVLTYNGTAYFGFSADAHAVPDLSKLETFAVQSFAELRKATSVRAQRKTVPKRRAVAPATGGASLAARA
ncbi:MAG: wax ester/triacylglycerol synthase domain-containing protein [Terriglobales bacterium]|jgi:diacylglycerol O-acyltransferase